MNGSERNGHARWSALRRGILNSPPPLVDAVSSLYEHTIDRIFVDKCRRHVQAVERRLAAGLSATAQTAVRRWLARIATDFQQA